jgi:hypothetical protein
MNVQPHFRYVWIFAGGKYRVINMKTGLNMRQPQVVLPFRFRNFLTVSRNTTRSSAGRRRLETLIPVPHWNIISIICSILYLFTAL